VTGTGPPGQPEPTPTSPDPHPEDESPPEVREDAEPSAQEADAEPHPQPDAGEPPQIRERPGLLERLGLERPDLIAMGVLVVVAFVLRFYSPLFPDFLTKPFQGPPISNCVQSTPVDPQNHVGTLCGLNYPFQRNYAQVGQPPTPPDGQVFDEIYFAVFAHNDLKGVSYFDPEPPLAKYLIAAGEWGTGAFDRWFGGKSGDPADLGFNQFGWRITVLVFGTLVVPLMYLLAIQLWRNRWFAVAAGTLCCFDGMFFIQSRIGMIDVIPIFFIMASYTLFLFHLKSRSTGTAVATLLLTGAALGIAIASKWIALAALASIAFFLVARPLATRVRLSVGSWTWAPRPLPLPGGMRPEPYVAAFVVALIVLPVAIYIVSWIPFFTRGQFHTFGDLVTYQWQMYQYHADLKATHPYGSKWYTWPALLRPVAYYFESQGLGTDAVTGQPLVAGMVNLGNPIIWWASLPALVATLYFLVRDRSWPAAVILVGFATQWLPFARVTRVMFLYHMFGGLIFMILALAFVLARLQQTTWRTSDGEERTVTVPWLVPVFLLLAIAAFLYFYPVWTGLPIGQSSYLREFPLGKMWLRSWI
jgi:predicted membrane-bound dolichyl-phosphate-mannose-protein mannosyltransferase